MTAAVNPYRATAERWPARAPAGRVLIVSNRLPFTVVAHGDDVAVRSSAGGLVSALEPVHARSHSIWIGCAGGGAVAGDARRRVDDELHVRRAVHVPLSELEFDGFYRRYANGVLWPVLHGLPVSSPRSHRGWGMYRAANERFAEVVAARWQPGDQVWVHDYQLMLLPALLRERLPDARIGFFLHTPMGRHELERLPEWGELSRGLLGADVVGFQTGRDARQFMEGVGGMPDRDGGTVVHDGRRVRLLVCPIAVDHEWFATRTRHPQVQVRRAALHVDGQRPLFVGVDRLDYTKGIPERLMAFDALLASDPGLRGRARFIQVAVPSREDVSGYLETQLRVGGIVAQINRRHGTEQWTPVDYVHGSVSANDLVALYMAADVMVVTPHRDGMNLVAKEFVASRVDGGGRLVLGRGAGAAFELSAAVLVDGGDVESILAGYRQALGMSATAARSSMRELRAVVTSRDVFGWAERFLAHLGAVADDKGETAMSANVAAVSWKDLEIIRALMGMRLQLRAHEARRVMRVREVAKRAAELSKALAAFAHEAGALCQTPQLCTEGGATATVVRAALEGYAAAVASAANEFRTLVAGNPA